LKKVSIFVVLKQTDMKTYKYESRTINKETGEVIQSVELELTNYQKQSLIDEVKEYGKDGLLFLLDVHRDNYKKGSNCWNRLSADIDFVKDLVD